MSASFHSSSSTEIGSSSQLALPPRPLGFPRAASAKPAAASRGAAPLGMARPSTNAALRGAQRLGIGQAGPCGGLGDDGAAISAPRHPGRSVRRRGRPAQNATLLRSPLPARATRHTSPASAPCASPHACLMKGGGASIVLAPIKGAARDRKLSICGCDTAVRWPRPIAAGSAGCHASGTPLGCMPCATNCCPRPSTLTLPNLPLQEALGGSPSAAR
jgi:hypothetical protein